MTSRYREVAAQLRALEQWAQDALAAGAPPKWVVLQMVVAVRAIAGTARLLSDLEHLEDQ